MITIKLKVLALAGVLGMVFAPSTQTLAADWTLEAKSLIPNFVSDFTIQFTDTNNDGLLEIAEVTHFSGVDLGSVGFLEEVNTVPEIPEIALLSGDNQSYLTWLFCGETKVCWYVLGDHKDIWNYQLFLNISSTLKQLSIDTYGFKPGKALANKVANTEYFYENNDIASACNELEGFINLAEAQSGKKPTPEFSETLIRDAALIMDALDCP